MTRVILFIMASVTLCTLTTARPKCSNNYTFPFVSRAEWGANPPRGMSLLTLPVPYVVIHHSYSPGVCMTKEECINAMTSMQTYHQDGQGWADIGYNFAVGGEGRVYEGRGWEAVGAHAVGYNVMSIGICLIGDWVSALPPTEALEATRQLIAAGVELGYVSPNYELIGHRQASATECPGETLYKEISTWDRFRRDETD